MEDGIQQNMMKWVRSLKGWQCELAHKILTKHQLEEEDINEIVSMLKEETSFEEKDFPSFGTSIDGHNVTLISIDSIKNIEQLAPRKPLTFAGKGMTVIYGKNGTGKSGYTRILKKICGKPLGRDLKGNIYKPNGNDGNCHLTYKIDGEERDCNWNINDVAIDDLKVVDIFDSDMGLGYLNNEKEVSYIPPIIDFFSRFTQIHDAIRDILSTEKGNIQTNLPQPPAELVDTNFIKEAYRAGNLELPTFIWTAENEKELSELEQKLKETDFIKAAKDIRLKKQKTDTLIEDICNWSEKVTAQHQKEIMDIRETLKTCKQAEIDAGKALKNVSKLDGIGTESWKKLWSAAKEYAVSAVNEKNTKLCDLDFCVLCHQPLNGDARDRLQRFDAFISNKLSVDVAEAQKKYNDEINNLPTPVTKEIIDDKCIASGIEEIWQNKIFETFTKIFNNVAAIKDGIPISDISDELQKTLSYLRKLSEAYNQNAIKYDENAKSFDRDAENKKLLELKARKWCNEQLEYIKTEILQREEAAKYDGWIPQTNTRNITAKAKEIENIIITQSYINRFNRELNYLGADNIKVKLDKKTNKGTTRHFLRIDSATNDTPINILSEGETRIIELAAFLADVTGGNNNNPFVFDDPISSLDQDYEEKTVKRLATLSKCRQVIVFTHRLSLLSQLIETCENIEPYGITTEPWGTGEIGDLHISAKNPKKALHALRDSLVVKAQREYDNDGYSAYYPLGKALCSEFRVLIERVIETHLLCGVVERFRRSINTMGKIFGLAEINRQDCEFFDGLMSKYSFPEHSQPQESPRGLPLPDEIKEDIIGLDSWIDNFGTRAKKCKGK